MKINNFRGDQTDVSAKKEALTVVLQVDVEIGHTCTSNPHET